MEQFIDTFFKEIHFKKIVKMDLEYQSDYYYSRDNNFFYTEYEADTNETYEDIMSGDYLEVLREDVMGMVTGFSSDKFVPEKLSLGAKTALAFLYGIVVILAVFGNGLVILVISSAEKMQTVTNRFLLSLAVSDIFMAIINMPMTLLFYLKNEWIFGEFLCKFNQYLQGVFVTANIFTLTAIGIDRFVSLTLYSTLVLVSLKFTLSF